MADQRFLDWPFFEPHHRQLARELDAWAGEAHARIARTHDAHDADALTRAWVRALGEGGWLRHSAIDPDHPERPLDVRSLCLIRDTLARLISQGRIRGRHNAVPVRELESALYGQFCLLRN